MEVFNIVIVGLSGGKEREGTERGGRGIKLNLHVRVYMQFVDSNGLTSPLTVSSSEPSC